MRGENLTDEIRSKGGKKSSKKAQRNSKGQFMNKKLKEDKE